MEKQIIINKLEQLKSNDIFFLDDIKLIENIIDILKITPVYVCDRNRRCNEHCGECSHTTEISSAMNFIEIAPNVYAELENKNSEEESVNEDIKMD